jgi:hypothetical protein
MRSFVPNKEEDKVVPGIISFAPDPEAIAQSQRTLRSDDSSFPPSPPLPPSPDLQLILLLIVERNLQLPLPHLPPLHLRHLPMRTTLTPPVWTAQAPRAVMRVAKRMIRVGPNLRRSIDGREDPHFLLLHLTTGSEFMRRFLSSLLTIILLETILRSNLQHFLLFLSPLLLLLEEGEKISRRSCTRMRGSHTCLR